MAGLTTLGGGGLDVVLGTVGEVTGVGVVRHGDRWFGCGWWIWLFVVSLEMGWFGDDRKY